MARPPRIRLLVTGFGPFPGMPVNPSGQLLDWLRERPYRFGHDVELRTALVPTVWTVAEAFVSGSLAGYDPDIAIHFGVHRRAAGFRIEKFARNCAGTHADANGQRFGQPSLLPGARQTLRATLDCEKILTLLKARRLPAATSISAGRYLCNMLFYLSLKQGDQRNKPRQAGFIHIPPLLTSARTGSRPFDSEMLVSGAEIIVEHCISVHRRQLAQAHLAEAG